MEILIFIAPLLLNVFGNTVYNIAGKSTLKRSTHSQRCH